MYSSSMSSGDCRKYARAVISASFISSVRHIQALQKIDDSVEKLHRNLMNKTTVSRVPEIRNQSLETVSTPSTPRKEKEAPERVVRPKNWSPMTDGKKAISAMIDQIWSIPYAPCQYVVQFICTVHLIALQRHKYCVRWQNGRRSAIFYVNIDESHSGTNVWVTFPGEIKAHPPHSSTAHFHRFLQRNLF